MMYLRKRILPLLCLFFFSQCVLSDNSNLNSDDSSGSIYQIGVGDQLNIYVWRNPELSITVPVRPDGRISLPLVDDIQAIEKTPVQLASEIEKTLSKFIKQPQVSVIVIGFGETLQSSIKIIGGGLKPVSIPYSQKIRLLDVVIKLGGFPETANLGDAKVIRQSNAKSESPIEISVDIDGLINKGDISQNIDMQRGDILIISEKWF